MVGKPRKMEMSVPISFGMECIEPDGLINALRGSKIGSFLVSSTGEFPRDHWYEGETYRGKGEVKNVGLMFDREVGEQFIKEHGGFWFPDFQEFNFIDKFKEKVLDARGDKQYFARDIDFKTFVGALKACIPNAGFYKNPEDKAKEQVKWNGRISQLESVADLAEGVEICRLRDSGESKLFIMLDLPSKGIEYAGIGIYSLGFDDGLWPMDVKVNLNPKQLVDMREERDFEGYFRRPEINLILKLTNDFAKEQIENDRERVGVGYESDTKTFCLGRDNYHNAGTGSNAIVQRVPTGEMVKSVQDVTNYLSKAIAIGFKQYKEGLAAGAKERRGAVLASKE